MFEMPTRSPAAPRPAETRRERGKADKARRLSRAARRLFRARGFEATTMREVASAADLGLGTVYSYVRDKHALLELISREDLELAEERAFSTLPPDAPIKDAIVHVVRCLYEHHATDVALARVIVKELSFARDATSDARRERFLAFFMRLAGLLERAREKGELGVHVNSLAATQVVFGVHFYHLIVWLSDPHPGPMPAQIFADSLDVVLAGLLPQAPAALAVKPKKERPS